VGNEIEIFSRDTVLFPGANVPYVYITEPISEPAQFIPEDGSSNILRNVDISIQDYILLQLI
jgi:hypothetical protein